ncbi:MAG: hypothetical protein JWQ19_3396 [Subtercola sp.]|nr:hypothetical protein [Subtercola sp.]
MRVASVHKRLMSDVPTGEAQFDRVCRKVTELANARAIHLESPADEMTLARFESDFSVRLPSRFRSFLLHVSRCAPGPGGSLLSSDRFTEAIEAEAVSCLSTNFALDPHREFADYGSSEPAAGAISIADGEELVLLPLNGLDRGKVIYFHPGTRSAAWQWIASPLRKASFLDWYDKWLDFALSGREAWFPGAWATLGTERELVNELGRPQSPEALRGILRGLISLGAPTPATLRAVDTIFATSELEVRATALELLARHHHIDTETVAAELNNTSVVVRLAAVRQLWRDQSRTASVRLARALDDRDPSVVELTLIAFSARNELTVDHLARVSRSNSAELHANLRSRIASELRAFPSTNTQDLLGLYLQDKAAEVRIAAAHSLGRFGAAGAARLEAALTLEPSTRVRSVIEQAIKRAHTRS